MAFVGSFISGVTAAVKAGGAISALPGAATSAKVGIAVGKFAVAAAPVVKTAATVATVATVAKTGIALLQASKQASKGLDLPAIPQTPTAPTIETARAEEREETLELIRRKRAGTIRTSPQGTLLQPVNVVGKTLLGA